MARVSLSCPYDLRGSTVSERTPLNRSGRSMVLTMSTIGAQPLQGAICIMSEGR